MIGKTRPTAVNLFWAIRRMQEKFERARIRPIAQIKQDLIEESQRMHAEDIAANQAMGRHGATLMPSEGGVLTHCNAGALATAGYGTALGVIRAAVEQGKKIHVYADETRPFLQGSRLTAWELMKDGIPTTVISDNMAGAMMWQGKIGAIVVGADRIAANGDVANKIGTYSVAVLAREHGIPFYVAAPLSTVDLACPDGSKIPIEQRDAQGSHAHRRETDGARTGCPIENPAFDVTPAKYVAAIITERGIARAPYEESLRGLAATEDKVEVVRAFCLRRASVRRYGSNVPCGTAQADVRGWLRCYCSRPAEATRAGGSGPFGGGLHLTEQGDW